MSIRINKYLSMHAVCSRRQADRLLEDNKVSINGNAAKLGDKVEDTDVVCVEGKVICKVLRKIYLKYNKPVGVVCTTATFDKNNIIDYIGYTDRIFPVGRLDKNSEGLLLLTNDGSIVNPILRGANNHNKTYEVSVDKVIDKKLIGVLERGVPILNTITKPCTIKQLDEKKFEITITQGLNRQIRRMCEYVGLRVVKLKRISIMDIKLGSLKLGELKELSASELECIRRVCNG